MNFLAHPYINFSCTGFKLFMDDRDVFLHKLQFATQFRMTVLRFLYLVMLVVLSYVVFLDPYYYCK